MKLDPKHLAQLSVIVEAGSFQAAADRLGLTQPALSRNMNTLESRLGSGLFHREGRRSIPNKLALRLARNGLSIRLAGEEASVIADQSAQGGIGELRIGAPPIIAGRFLTDALAEFTRNNLHCSIELRTGLVHELRAMLERGQIDIVFGPQSLINPNASLEFEHLIDDRVGILCRIGHELTKHQKVSVVDLENQSWIAHSRGSLLRKQTEAAMIAAGIKSMHIAFETDSIRTVLEMITSTDLITVMPRATTAPYLENELVFLDFDSPQFQRQIGIIRRKNSLQNSVEENFLKILIRSTLLS
ncbi:LysR family transcriptional regulator [Leucothrix sargassi]|nr:LysR family transcriptional regulator [Leucothrix sargassi]